MVPARKIRSACLRFLPGHWALSMQNLILLRFTDTPGFAEPTPPVRILRGGPRASPTQFRKAFLRTVGEGLKVNRPKAERSHPGVCPYENNTAATRSAVGAALAVACTPGANPGGRMLCAPTGFRWTVGAAPCGRPLRRFPLPVGRGLPDTPFRPWLGDREGRPYG